ncbi:hypothetical protein DEJ30_10965 [Curtobacterium sp. MCPF17_003]|nr:hypothetical protein DEJ30_10965 [Curtobacterium sp. MCPF17_003]PZE71904.1 hypothetical protein DEJ27_03810 [Curtobacterium sp. MCPF17_018]
MRLIPAQRSPQLRLRPHGRQSLAPCRTADLQRIVRYSTPCSTSTPSRSGVTGTRSRSVGSTPHLPSPAAVFRCRSSLPTVRRSTLRSSSKETREPGWPHDHNKGVRQVTDPARGHSAVTGLSARVPEPIVATQSALRSARRYDEYGKDADGNYLTRDSWEDRYIDWNEERQSYLPEDPGNADAVAGHLINWLNPHGFVKRYGSKLDRLGKESGNFFSFAGTSFEQRALPPSNLSEAYRTYDFDAAAFEGQGLKIEVSEIAPAFGHQEGGQVRFIDPGPPVSFRSSADLRELGIPS